MAIFNPSVGYDQNQGLASIGTIVLREKWGEIAGGTETKVNQMVSTLTSQDVLARGFLVTQNALLTVSHPLCSPQNMRVLQGDFKEKFVVVFNNENGFVGKQSYNIDHVIDKSGCPIRELKDQNGNFLYLEDTLDDDWILLALDRPVSNGSILSLEDQKINLHTGADINILGFAADFQFSIIRYPAKYTTGFELSNPLNDFHCMASMIGHNVGTPVFHAGKVIGMVTAPYRIKNTESSTLCSSQSAAIRCQRLDSISELHLYTDFRLYTPYINPAGSFHGGLSIMAECQNQRCEVYQQVYSYSFGMGSFQRQNLKQTSCFKCEQLTLKITAYVLSLCCYTLEGQTAHLIPKTLDHPGKAMFGALTILENDEWNTLSIHVQDTTNDDIDRALGNCASSDESEGE